MSDCDALNAFLRTDPGDVGCDLALDALHAYAEMAAAGTDVEACLPGVAAHLQACCACAEDHEALLRALRGFGAGEPL